MNVGPARPDRRLAWSAAVALALAGAASAQVRIAVALPEPIAGRLLPAFAEFAPDAVVAAAGTSAAALAELPADTVIVGVGERQLLDLTMRGALAPLDFAVPAEVPSGPGHGAPTRFVLPWSSSYGVAWRTAELNESEVPTEFEALALEPDVHDRLLVCDPSGDPEPWLLAMGEMLRRGDPEATGLALWTTIDARVQRLCRDYGDLLREIGGARPVAAVVPMALVRAGALPAGWSGRPIPAAVVRLGLGVRAPASAAALTIAAGLVQPALAQRLAGRAGLDGAVPVAVPTFDQRLVDDWLRHFREQIAGRGRGIEELSDWLDLGFALLFLAGALLYWRHQRRRTAAEAA